MLQCCSSGSRSKNSLQSDHPCLTIPDHLTILEYNNNATVLLQRQSQQKTPSKATIRVHRILITKALLRLTWFAQSTLSTSSRS